MIGRNVPDNVVVPAGLQIKFDVSTGRTQARSMPRPARRNAGEPEVNGQRIVLEQGSVGVTATAPRPTNGGVAANVLICAHPGCSARFPCPTWPGRRPKFCPAHRKPKKADELGKTAEGKPSTSEDAEIRRKVGLSPDRLEEVHQAARDAGVWDQIREANETEAGKRLCTQCHAAEPATGIAICPACRLQNLRDIGQGKGSSWR